MKVRVVPLQPHCFAFGGFELQMLGALEASREAGVDVERLDPWSRDSDYDILHLWGCDFVHISVAHWARLAGKKLVMSALFPYPSARALLRYRASLVLGTARFRRPMLSWLSALTVVNWQQARYAVSILGFPESRTFVVPNIVDDIFFEPPDRLAGNRVEVEDYVICTGNVSRRKNQLSLVRACRRVGIPLLLIGSTLSGEDAYGEAVLDAMTGAANMQWIRGLPANSPELAYAYRKSLMFALPSHDEKQPISALEAAAVGKPLLLANRAYARQEWFTNAALADPKSEESIEATLRRVLEHPDKYRAAPDALGRCRRSAVGAMYTAVYKTDVRR